MASLHEVVGHGSRGAVGGPTVAGGTDRLAAGEHAGGEGGQRSARRQLTTIGQLAANGALGAVVRRSLVLQGSWSGLAGGVAGLLVAGAGLAVGRPIVADIARRDYGGYDVSVPQLIVVLVTAVASASVAALVPARSAARIPVLSALAGRRPVAPPARRLAPVGLGAFAVGVLLLLGAVVASSGGGQRGAGGHAVDALRLLALGGSWRLSIRGLVRQRARSAAVVTAIATIGAGAMVAGTVANRIVDGDPIDDVPSLPADTVLVRPPHVEPNAGHGSPFELPADLEASLRRILPDATFTSWRVATFEPGPTTDEADFYPGSFVVADDPVLDVVGLSAPDRATLQRAGALALHTWNADGTGENSEGSCACTPRCARTCRSRGPVARSCC